MDVPKIIECILDAQARLEGSVQKHDEQIGASHNLTPRRDVDVEDPRTVVHFVLTAKADSSSLRSFGMTRLGDLGEHGQPKGCDCPRRCEKIEWDKGLYQGTTSVVAVGG